MSAEPAAKRPWLCRWWSHKWAKSTQDLTVLPFVRWRTECPRCGTLLCYSLEPFVR